MKSVWSWTTSVGLAVAASSAMSAPSNEQLTIATTQEFETLNPLIMTMATSTYLSYMVNRPLMVIDSAWNWQCELCTTIPTLENGAAKIIEDKGVKKIAVQWQLKKDLKWGDGQPITAQDFKLAWEIGLSPNVSVASKETWDKVEAVTIDAKDPLKFTTTFKEARYDYYQLAWNPMPSAIEAKIWAQSKAVTGSYEKLTAYTTDPLNPGLYNGPYAVTELKLGSHVIVKQNANFAGKKPAIKKIIVKLIPNTQALEAALLSGDVDMGSEMGMTFDQAVEFDKRMAKDPANKGRFKTLFRDGLVYEHIDLNLRNPILAEKNVRKALVYAIDRKKLTDALFTGKQKPAISNFHPLDPYFTEDVVHYEANAAKAKALLEQVGWQVGADGVREKDGKKLALTIMTTADNKTRELVQTYVQAELKKIGIALSIKNEPARVFFGETTRKAAYTGLAMYAWIASPDSPPRSTLHSKEIPTAANAWSGQNSAGFSNQRVDELLDAVFGEFDFNKRKAMLGEVQKIYTEEVPVIPLYLRAQISNIPAKLQGFELTGHQFYSTLAVEDWTFDAKTAH